MEERVRLLEQVVAENLPHVDIERLVQSRPGSVAHHIQQDELSPATGTQAICDSISEAVPEEEDGFDWQEEANDFVDGMAALALEPKGAGYLGRRLLPHPPGRRVPSDLLTGSRSNCWGILPPGVADLCRR